MTGWGLNSYSLITPQTHLFWSKIQKVLSEREREGDHKVFFFFNTKYPESIPAKLAEGK